MMDLGHRSSCPTISLLAGAIFSLADASAIGPVPCTPDGPVDVFKGNVALNRHLFGWYTIKGTFAFSDSTLVFLPEQGSPLFLDTVVIRYSEIRALTKGTIREAIHLKAGG